MTEPKTDFRKILKKKPKSAREELEAQRTSRLVVKSDNTTVSNPTYDLIDNVKRVDERESKREAEKSKNKPKLKPKKLPKYLTDKNTAERLLLDLIDNNFLSAKNSKGRTNADGHFYDRSQKALQEALDNGYIVKNNRLVAKPTREQAVLEGLYKDREGISLQLAIDSNPTALSSKAAKDGDFAGLLQLLLVDLKFLDALNEKGRTNVDRHFGKRSEAALNEAIKNGYYWNGEKLELKPKLQPKQEGPSLGERIKGIGNTLKERMWLGTGVGALLDKALNYSPFAALGNAKLRGVLGLDKNYDITDKERLILSDLSQFTLDNWESSINFGIGTTSNLLNTNLRKLAELKLNNGSPEEIKELETEIENNKKSIASLVNKRNKFKLAGGLQLYLMAHPGEKVVLGGNFRFYKDRNQHRFPKGTPTGYAKFADPNFALWAESTPLGQVEAKYGNNQQSWVYDPETGLILTRVSDSYNFNPIGTEGLGLVGNLRAKVGKDPDLLQTHVRYSGDLLPIVPGKKNYLNTEDFGSTYSGVGKEGLRSLGNGIIKSVLGWM